MRQVSENIKKTSPLARYFATRCPHHCSWGQNRLTQKSKIVRFESLLSLAPFFTSVNNTWVFCVNRPRNSEGGGQDIRKMSCHWCKFWHVIHANKHRPCDYTSKDMQVADAALQRFNPSIYSETVGHAANWEVQRLKTVASPAIVGE